MFGVIIRLSAKAINYFLPDIVLSLHMPQSRDYCGIVRPLFVGYIRSPTLYWVDLRAVTCKFYLRSLKKHYDIFAALAFAA